MFNCFDILHFANSSLTRKHKTLTQTPGYYTQMIFTVIEFCGWSFNEWIINIQTPACDLHNLLAQRITGDL